METNAPRSITEWKSEHPSMWPLPLKERIRLAREHMEHYGQQHDTLWTHQQFALTIRELLDAAERGA
jgi:hypothetical protein